MGAPSTDPENADDTDGPSYWTAGPAVSAHAAVGAVVTLVVAAIVWLVVALSFYNAATGEPIEGYIHNRRWRGARFGGGSL